MRGNEVIFDKNYYLNEFDWKFHFKCNTLSSGIEFKLIEKDFSIWSIWFDLIGTFIGNGIDYYWGSILLVF